MFNHVCRMPDALFENLLRSFVAQFRLLPRRPAAHSAVPLLTHDRCVPSSSPLPLGADVRPQSSVAILSLSLGRKY